MTPVRVSHPLPRTRGLSPGNCGVVGRVGLRAAFPRRRAALVVQLGAEAAARPGRRGASSMLSARRTAWARGSGLGVRDRIEEEGQRAQRLPARPCAGRARMYAVADLAASAADDLQAGLGRHLGRGGARARRRSAASLPGPQPGSRPASPATRSSTSATVSSPSQPGPKHREQRLDPAGDPQGGGDASRASHRGLASPGSPPRASTSPPTSTHDERSQSSSSAALAIPAAATARPRRSRRPAPSPCRDALPSATRRTALPRASSVRRPASTAASPSGRPPRISAIARGPGWGSIGESLPGDAAEHDAACRATRRARATASAPTTSPPPRCRARARARAARTPHEVVRSRGSSGGDGLGVARRSPRISAAARSNSSSAITGRALEGQVAVDLDPGAAAVVLVADAHRDRPRDAVDPQHQDVQRVARASSCSRFSA